MINWENRAADLQGVSVSWDADWLDTVTRLAAAALCAPSRSWPEGRGQAAPCGGADLIGGACSTPRSDEPGLERTRYMAHVMRMFRYSL